MPKRGIVYFAVLILLFSFTIVSAQKPGTCKNPSGGTYCGQKSQVDDCYCDDVCTTYGDCCSDYKNVCTKGTTPLSQTPSLTINGGTYAGLYYGNEWVLKVFGESNSDAKLYCKTPSGNEVCNGLFLCTTGPNNGNPSGECKSSGKITKDVQEGTWEEWVIVNGAESNHITFGVKSNILQNPPQPPFDLVVSTAIDFEGKLIAKLEWKNVDGEAFYIYKNKNDGDFKFLSKTQNKFYKDESGLSKDIKYGYYVTAVNNFGESKPSDTVYVYPSAICIDSDGGKNYNVKGITEGILGVGGPGEGQYGKFEDYCAGGTSTAIYEFYCDNNKVHQSFYSCPNGCKDGVCLKESPATLDGAIFKPFVVDNPFTLSADASSQNSLITSVNWELGESCKYAPTFSAQTLSVSSYVTSSIEVVCYSEGLKTFYVTFKDDKGNKISDKVSVYIDVKGSAKTTTAPSGGTPPTTVTGPSSCKNRCGNYDSKAKCQCDSVCTQYGDCCADKKHYC